MFLCSVSHERAKHLSDIGKFVARAHALRDGARGDVCALLEDHLPASYAATCAHIAHVHLITLCIDDAHARALERFAVDSERAVGSAQSAWRGAPSARVGDADARAITHSLCTLENAAPSRGMPTHVLETLVRRVDALSRCAETVRTRALLQ